MARVSDKIALVTGAASGIGCAAALALAREGAHVVATDIDRERAEDVANEIRRGNRGAIAVKHDARVEPEWKAAVDAAVREFGRLDVLVNNAGIGPSKPLLETSLEDWHAVMRINLDGVFLGVRIGVEAMRATPSRPRRGPGSIINLSSILGLVGMAETAAYSASKGGVRLLTKSAALECAEKGYEVRINSVHPGFPGRVKTQAWFSVGYDEERTLALCVALGAQKACPGSRRAGFQGLDQAVRAEDLDGSLDVVAEDPQRPLASGFFQPPHQEAWASHHPFHRPEGVLGDAAPQPHPFRVGGGALVHRLTGVFVEAAHDRTSARRRALRLEGTIRAGFGPILFLLLGPRDLAAGQGLPGGASIGVRRCVISESVAGEERLAFRIDRLGARRDRRDPGLGALARLIAVRIADIGNDSQGLDAQSLPGLLRHRQKLALVVAFVGQIEGGDQLVLAVDRDLGVVGDLTAFTRSAHQPRLALALDALLEVSLGQFARLLLDCRPLRLERFERLRHVRPVGSASSCRSASSIAARCSLILRSTAAKRSASFLGVITVLKLATAAIFVPPIATASPAIRDCRRQNRTKARHVLTIASAWSLRKSAIVLNDGRTRLISHITSKLRAASRSRRRLERI